MKVTYIAKILNGNIHVNDHRGWIAHKASLEGRSVRITLEPATRKRSLPQNDYYWAVVVPIVRDGIFDATGEVYSHEEVHEFLKGKFNAAPVANKQTGEVELIARSTASLKVSDFIGYLAMIKRWASDFLNVRIPDPNEQTEIIL